MYDAVMVLAVADLYDETDTRTGAGASVPEITDPTGIAGQVASLLRSDIYSGRYPAGSELPSQREIAASHRISDGTVNRAFADLAAMELVQTGSGRRTTVMPLYMHVVKVVTPISDKDHRQLRTVERRLTERLENDPAIGSATVLLAGQSGDWDSAEFQFTLTVPNPAQAAITAFSAVVFAAAGGTWDVARSSVHVQPLDGRHRSY